MPKVSEYILITPSTAPTKEEYAVPKKENENKETGRENIPLILQEPDSITSPLRTKTEIPEENMELVMPSDTRNQGADITKTEGATVVPQEELPTADLVATTASQPGNAAEKDNTASGTAVTAVTANNTDIRTASARAVKKENANSSTPRRASRKKHSPEKSKSRKKSSSRKRSHKHGHSKKKHGEKSKKRRSSTSEGKEHRKRNNSGQKSHRSAKSKAKSKSKKHKSKRHSEKNSSRKTKSRRRSKRKESELITAESGEEFDFETKSSPKTSKKISGESSIPSKKAPRGSKRKHRVNLSIELLKQQTAALTKKAKVKEPVSSDKASSPESSGKTSKKSDSHSSSPDSDSSLIQWFSDKGDALMDGGLLTIFRRKQRKAPEMLAFEKIQSSDKYSHNWEYVSLIASLFVGLTNLYTFPDRMHRHGGYWYLLPYTVCTILYAIPVSYIESYIGQLTQEPPIIGYQKVAPILQLVCWIDATNMIILSLKNIIHIILAIQDLVIDPNVSGACMGNYTSHCMSQNDDRICSNYTSEKDTITKRYTYKNCFNLAAEKQVLENPFRAYIPYDKYYQSYTNNRSKGVFDIGTPNIAGLTCATFVVWGITQTLLLPIRHFAKVAGVLTGISGAMLLSVIIHLYVNWPPDVIPWDEMSPVTYPKSAPLFSHTVWLEALCHVVQSFSVGNSNISTLSSFSKRDTWSIKYIIYAVLIDYVFGIFGIFIGAAVSSLSSYSRSTSFMVTDFVGDSPRASIQYLLKAVPQFMSYYKAKAWIFVYLLALALIIWTTVMVTQLYLREFVAGLFNIKAKWKNVVIAGGIMTLCCALFSFSNNIYLYDWTVSSQNILSMWSLAMKQIIIIGCYGAAQVNFDMAFMISSSAGKVGDFWKKADWFFRELYFLLALPITFIYVSYVVTSVDWTDKRVVPVAYFRKHPALGLFVNPSMTPAVIATLIFLVRMFFRYRDTSEIFKVQPDLPSYQRIRVGIQEFEDVAGKDLDDLRMRREDREKTCLGTMPESDPTQLTTEIHEY